MFSEKACSEAVWRSRHNHTDFGEAALVAAFEDGARTSQSIYF